MKKKRTLEQSAILSCHSNYSFRNRYFFIEGFSLSSPVVCYGDECMGYLEK